MKKPWIKCPSVTHGGQPHFWHNAIKNTWVVWDRGRAKWVISNETKILGEFDSEKEACKNAENLCI